MLSGFTTNGFKDDINDKNINPMGSLNYDENETNQINHVWKAQICMDL